jgi:phospholipid/cholesterol/gamma-HCH transport system permease protein
VAEASGPGFVGRLERTGRSVVAAVDSFGFGAHLFFRAIYYFLFGRRVRQTVRAESIFARMMADGIEALPIVSMLSAAIGITLVIQGIDSLEAFGAQDSVVLGVAITVTREFGPLITGILVAGRSGSALAARVSTMTISQEIDALKVMGINPIRYIVSPSLIAMMIVLPALTLWSILISLFGAGLFVMQQLGTTMAAYISEVNAALDVDDVVNGLSKSVIFAVLITIVGVVDGSSVKGGAEGVGQVTRAAVVHAISAIVVTDMIFVFATS